MLEIMVVLVLVIILALLVSMNLFKSRQKTKLTRISAELADIAKAVTQFAEDNNYQYPADTARGLPNGLEKYLAGGVWPESIWPEGVFDWDNWTTVAGVPSPQILQVTYRLCDLDDPVSECKDPVLFPHFVRNSSIFYCLSGPCVPHQSTPNVPGYCVNCKPKEVNPPL